MEALTKAEFEKKSLQTKVGGCSGGGAGSAVGCSGGGAGSAVGCSGV